MSAPPVSRVFVVGCPCSGTTLVQTMLGSHPGVLTLPETHYFQRAHARGWRRLQAGGDPVRPLDPAAPEGSP